MNKIPIDECMYVLRTVLTKVHYSTKILYVLLMCLNYTLDIEGFYLVIQLKLRLLCCTLGRFALTEERLGKTSVLYLPSRLQTNDTKNMETIALYRCRRG